MTPAWLRDLGGADPYQLLGVARDATRDDIVRAHRQRIREFHPDRMGSDSERARLVNLARDVLLDPVRRYEYDRRGERPAEPEPPRSAWDTEDVVVGTEPPPSSAWDGEDVVLGAEPPQASDDHPQLPDYQWYQPEYYQPPPYFYYPYPAYAEAPRPSLGLPIAALVFSLVCSPVGLILGIVALRQHWRSGGAGRGLAIAAVAVSAASLVLGCLCYGGAFLSTTQSGTA